MSGSATLSYLIISLAVGYAFTMPYFGEVSNLLYEKAQIQDQIDKAKDIESRKNTLLDDFNKISAEDIKKVETLIPSSLNFVKLVADIDAVASRHGISINQVSSSKNSPQVASIAEAEAVMNTQTHESAIISFEFASSYVKFNDFLNDLERSLRILDVKSLQLTTNKDGIYMYQVSFETYWSN